VHAEVDAVTQHHVEEMVDTLCAEFEGRFERPRIEELMADSVRQLAGQANVEDFLPVLAYRFTRERLSSIGRTPGTSWDVVFVSLSGGGRGQIAAALTTLLSKGHVTPHAAGTSQHGVLDATVEAIIRELGVDTSELFVRPVSPDVLAAADVIVTMGHSVGEVELPQGVKRQDWRVGDPVGASVEEARRVRDDIERRVRELLAELQVLAPDAGAQAPELDTDETDSDVRDSAPSGSS
jgi:protein-tyrosine-phosphatase